MESRWMEHQEQELNLPEGDETLSVYLLNMSALKMEVQAKTNILSSLLTLMSFQTCVIKFELRLNVICLFEDNESQW